MNRLSASSDSLALVLGVILGCGLAGCGRSGRESAAALPPARELRVAHVEGELPALDPLSSAWDGAREVIVDLLPQDVMEPRVPDSVPDTLRLRGLHDGKRVVFRLEWQDPQADDLVDVDRSSDAVAIQLPATGDDGPLPDAMMGEGGKPVLILQWRAILQRRLEGKAHGIEALYPNATVDHYPFEAAKEGAARAAMERRYAPARAAGNQIASQKVTSAVQDLTAEGFGTLAFASEQRSTGQGVHGAGRWVVTICRPLDPSPGSATGLRPGASTFVAVAVWDGGRAHTGSKKMRSIWVPLQMEGPSS